MDGAQTGEADRRCPGKRGGLLGGCLTTASVTERVAWTKFRLIATERRLRAAETKVAAVGARRERQAQSCRTGRTRKPVASCKSDGASRHS